jgi:hypothetical protein
MGEALKLRNEQGRHKRPGDAKHDNVYSRREDDDNDGR